MLKDNAPSHSSASTAQVIKDANRMQELPAPNYGGDSYMVKHAEQAQAFIASNFKIHEPNLPAPPDEMAA